jgi:hypothetical protein
LLLVGMLISFFSVCGGSATGKTKKAGPLWEPAFVAAR